jgi:glucose/arabinose dehydrogenase
MHYAGEIAFGPDGLLYVSLGDAHQSWLAQRAGLYGNVVRFDPRRPRRRSSFAIGLRNPYRFSFDRETGDFALADVGEDRYDELNFVPAGRKRKTNFGWPHFEGPLTRLTGTPPRRAVGPALALAHPYVSAVVGGYVVRDPRMRRHQGRYLFGDFCDGWLATTRLARSARDTRLEGLTVPYLSGFGQAANGRLYATSIAGPVYAVLEAAPAAPRQ